MHDQPSHIHRTSRSALAAAALAVVVLTAIPAAAQAPRLAFDHSIGCDFCEGPELFREIQSITITDGGDIIATDGDAPHVRVFMSDGSIGQTLGPEGDGPGELRTPLRAFRRADGTLTVVDLSQKRATRFADDGEVLRTGQLMAFPAGGGYAIGADRILLTITDFQGGLALVEMTDDGTIDTVLAEVPYQEGSGMRFISPAVRDDGGYAFGEGEKEYAIRVYGRDGRVEREIRRDVERRPRTREEIQALRDRMMFGGGAGRARAEGGRSQADVDPLQPHFSSLSALQFDENGRLWVRTSRGPSGSTTFDVFGRDGALLSSPTVEGSVGVYAVRAGWLAGVTQDENDIQRISVWRVED